MTGPRNGASGWPRDPYKGLNYFAASDAPLFGQRDVAIDEATRLLYSFDTRVVLLHGGTGAGKSSFLRAGLCPRLQRMSREEDRRFFFLPAMRPDGSAGDPLMIRATDDPVGRIFEALQNVANSKSNILPESVCEGVRQSLAGPLPHNRLDALPPILAALGKLTEPPQRDTLILLIDQAEEVLTLRSTSSAENVQRAFFELIEQVCFRSLDLRLIVALRTEYYGRFCSFFLIRPTTKLTPPTEFGAGLMDYLLRPLSAQDIAAAIRQPTLNEDRKDGLPPPRSIYKFFYEDHLPEMIATDLLRQAGEAGTLPSEASMLPPMQIVCKQLYEGVVPKEIPEGEEFQITERHYSQFGRAEGAINAFIDRALRDAAKAANLPELSNTDVDSWILVLSKVVGRAEGGTVQTLIASEQDLVAEASKYGIADNTARAMLSQMANPERRLLRVAGGKGGAPAYSLGHDSIGPSVLRWKTEAAARAEAEKKHAAERAASEAILAKQRERYRWLFKMAQAAFVGLAIVAALGQYAVAVYNEQQWATTLKNYAEHEPSSGFRLRLLLLAAALRIRETFPGSLFVYPDETVDALRRVLLRSPVFGGDFEAAAWDDEGQSVIRVENNKLIVQDLKKREDGKSFEFPAGSRISGTTSVGLAVSEDGSGAPIAFSNVTTKPMFGQEGGGALVEGDFALPQTLMEEQDLRISRAEFSRKKLRIVFLHYNESAIDRMKVLNVSGSIGKGFKPHSQTGTELDWNPMERRALRQPALAEDCDAYAYIGQQAPQTKEQPPTEFQLWFAQFEEQNAHQMDFRGDPLTGGAVSIARGCGWIAVRDIANLHLMPMKSHADSQPQTVELNLGIDGIVSLPTGQQAQPMFAAAPLAAGRGLRVGWSTAKGLAFVDVGPTETIIDKLANGKQMLTGADPGYETGSLSLSPNGLAALMTQFSGAHVQTRAFDLDFDARREDLSNLKTRDALIEACRIARLETGSNQLTPIEREIWLRNKNAPQPCPERK